MLAHVRHRGLIEASVKRSIGFIASGDIQTILISEIFTFSCIFNIVFT